MRYSPAVIHMTNQLETIPPMYSLILLKARGTSLLLNDIRCYLDGYYLFCLSEEDRITVYGGVNEVRHLHFLPYFYNVNLTHKVIGHPMYETMRANHGYPDFHLFRSRDQQFCGILNLSEEVYEHFQKYFQNAEYHVRHHDTDVMWSCHTRSVIISIMQLAESVFSGKTVEEDDAILLFIRNSLSESLTLADLCAHFNMSRSTLTRCIEEKTGLSPMQFVLEERLNQSRQDLLFTLIPVSEVAEKYGFSDVNYYIRAFKKRFGEPPLQYRNHHWGYRIENEDKYHLPGDLWELAAWENETPDMPKGNETPLE